MKIITRQTLANGAADRWDEQYKPFRNLPRASDSKKISELLHSLDNPVNPDEVDRIIGNTSWTTPCACSVCGKNNGPVIEVGEEPDYDSSTAWICFDCVEKVVKLAQEFKDGRHEHDRAE